jgi:hypothetical protein
MSNRKLAAIVIALVLGVGASVAWYLAGERMAARERAETAQPAPITSFACPPGHVASGCRTIRPPQRPEPLGRRS